MSSFMNIDGEIPHLPVELTYEPIRTPLVHDGVTFDNHFAIVQPPFIDGEFKYGEEYKEQRRPITVSKTNHAPVGFPVMWDSIGSSLLQSGIDLSNLQYRFNIAQNNAAFSVDIIFPRYEFEPVVGDIHSMRARIYDSHDMTFKRHISFGLYRYWCSNGCSSVKEQLIVESKHTTWSDPEKLGAVVANFPARLEAEAESYQTMVDTKVTREQAMEYIRHNLATYRKGSSRKLSVNEKMVEESARIYNMYENLGETGYRLYNTLTHIATHVEGRENTDLVRKQARIEQQIQANIDTPAFKELVGLAA